MVERIKSVILDEHRATAEYISDLLDSFPQVEVLGTAVNRSQLESLLLATGAEAAFLDIELPGGDGLAVAEQLKASNPHISLVFISAHIDQAIRAFDAGACDFLSKPIDAEKLGRAVQRIVRDQRFHRLENSHRSDPECLFIQTGRAMQVIPMEDILFIEKSNRQTQICTKYGDFACYESLDSLATRLSIQFLRTHRSFIVNTMKVFRCAPCNRSSYEVFFNGHKRSALLSKRHFNCFWEQVVK